MLLVADAGCTIFGVTLSPHSSWAALRASSALTLSAEREAAPVP